MAKSLNIGVDFFVNMDKKKYHAEWRKKNKDKLRQYYENSKEKNIERAKKHYRINKEKRLQQVKDWAEKNKEKVRKYKQDWKRQHREEQRFKEKIRRKTFGKYGSIKESEICVICSGKDNLHRHHNTVPYEVDKFVIVCNKCHNKIHNGR